MTGVAARTDGLVSGAVVIPRPAPAPARRVPTLHPGVLQLACTALDARPLFWEGEDGRSRRGYEPEAASALADLLGLELRWAYRAWDDRLGAVLRGEVDAVWCGVAVTPERAGSMRFSRPYARVDETCVVRAGTTAGSPSDLAGHRVGACAGSTNLALVQRWPDVQAVPFDGAYSGDVFGDMIAAVLAGEVDGFVDDAPAMIPLPERVPGLRVAFTVASGHPWAAALHPEATALAVGLDDAIGSLAADGTLARIWAEHLPFLPPPDLTVPHDDTTMPSSRRSRP
ncbi:MAG: substrate-binding periplasmic protein [Phycicoccus sp.]